MDTKEIAGKRDKLACDIQKLITTFEQECTAVVQTINLQHAQAFGQATPDTISVEVKVGIDV